MKRIDDPNRIEALLAASDVRGLFDTPGLAFQGFCFEKGEYLVAPGRRMDWLFFLVEGAARIYGIHESGSLLPVDRLNSPALLGDLEFVEEGRSTFYAEACGRVVCLALYLPPAATRLTGICAFCILCCAPTPARSNCFRRWTSQPPP